MTPPHDAAPPRARPLDDPARLRAVRRTRLLGTGPEEAFDRLTRLAARLTSAPVALLSLLDDERQFVTSRAAGPDAPALPSVLPAAQGFCRNVVVDGRAIAVSDLAADARGRALPAVVAGAVRAYAGVPLRDEEGHALGTLCVLDGAPRLWTDGDLAALTDLATSATAEIALRQALADARLGSLTDGLTGLWNRRHFVEALAAELERGSREGHGPGVVIVHLDDLRAVNEARGEAAGDALIATSAAAVAGALRPYDLAARWAGPRIAVLAPGVADDAALRAVGAKLCASLASDGRRLAAGGAGVSAGAARAGAGVGDPTQLMRAAERALEANRARGAGGVTLASDLDRPGAGPHADREPDDAEAERAMGRVAEAVAAGGAAPAALREVAEVAGTLTAADGAFVLRYIAGERIEILAEWRRSGAPPSGQLPVMPLGDAVAAAAVRATGRAARARRPAGTGDACLERVAAPVYRAGELWGAVAVVARGEATLPGGAEAQVVAVADAVGMGLSSIASGDRVVTETAATILAEDLDTDATLQAVAEAARRALGADRATCYEHTDDQRSVAAVHTTETDPERRAVLQRAVQREGVELPLWHRLVTHDAPTLVVEDTREAGMEEGLRRALGVGALIGVRLEHSSLRSGGQPTLLGSLFLAYHQPRRFSAAELATARSLAGLAGLAVANARLHAMTVASLVAAEERAAVDPLTGLANHRTFQDRLRGEIARARRERRNVALVVFDLDHFKSVNDRHGHQAGDRVLMDFARRLAAEARPSDLVARVGGEEFAWLLPGADAVQGWEAAERLRRGMERRPLAGPRRVTVSSGVCDLTDAADAEELYRLADGALYWAKAHGRDRCLRYSADVVQVLSAQEQADRLERTQTLASVRALARVVDAKDPSTLRHSGRVADLAVRLATALGWPLERAVMLRDAGLVHDVGKIGVPDSVLFKPGRLEPAEYEQVKLHASLGAEIVREVLGAEAVAWVRGHHERWDGRGYPDGLAGEAIPDGARILALADSWDVMVNVRHYKEPMAMPEALEECRRHSGGQFWPPAVGALERLVAAGALEADAAPAP